MKCLKLLNSLWAEQSLFLRVLSQSNRNRKCQFNVIFWTCEIYDFVCCYLVDSKWDELNAGFLWSAVDNIFFSLSARSSSDFVHESIASSDRLQAWVSLHGEFYHLNPFSLTYYRDFSRMTLSNKKVTPRLCILMHYDLFTGQQKALLLFIKVVSWLCGNDIFCELCFSTSV